MRSPNPTDSIEYELIDTFNRVGDIATDSTPTLGKDWDAGSSNLVATTAAGELDFSISGVQDYAIHQTATAGRTITFDLEFGGVNKAIFFYFRTDGGNVFLGTASGIEFRFKDDGASFLYRVREREDTGVVRDLVLETSLPNASLVGLTKFPVMLEDTGQELILRINDGDAVVVPTKFKADNSFFQIACALNSGNLVSNLRVWKNG